MKIGRRLMISYALLLAFLAAVLIVAVNRLDRLTQTTREVVEGDAARAALASAINLHAESAAGRLLLLFILEDREQRVVIYKEIDHHNAMIDRVIATINAQTKVATRDIQAGRIGMERGMELIKSIVAPLGELRDGAQSSLESLENLTGVAEKQARESQAIAANVSDIVGMAATNSHAAEAVAAITGELVEMANELQQSVDTFRL